MILHLRGCIFFDKRVCLRNLRAFILAVLSAVCWKFEKNGSTWAAQQVTSEFALE
jgi:hypothetical protein